MVCFIDSCWRKGKPKMVKAAARASPKPQLCRGEGSFVIPTCAGDKLPREWWGEREDGRAEGRNEPNLAGILDSWASKGVFAKPVVYFARRTAVWAGEGRREEETESKKSTLHWTQMHKKWSEGEGSPLQTWVLLVRSLQGWLWEGHPKVQGRKNPKA